MAALRMAQVRARQAMKNRILSRGKRLSAESVFNPAAQALSLWQAETKTRDSSFALPVRHGDAAFRPRQERAPAFFHARKAGSRSRRSSLAFHAKHALETVPARGAGPRLAVQRENVARKTQILLCPAAGRRRAVPEGSDCRPLMAS